MLNYLCKNAGSMQDFNNKITLTDQQKVDVLLKALDERYNALHIIRDRVQNVCLWVLALFITAAGWLLQSTHSFTNSERAFFTTMIITSVIIVRIFYLKDLEKGFKTQQQIQAKIEDALGLCKKGIFMEGSIYPEDWLNAGTKKGKGKFFDHNYLLIYLGTIFLILSIWIS